MWREETAAGHEHYASIFHFCCSLMTGSSVGMCASERTFVLALALQFEVVIGGGGCYTGLVDPAADWHG